MTINIAKAIDYIQTYFCPSPDAIRLCRMMFQYWNNYCEDQNITRYLTEMLGTLGFTIDDVEAWLDKEIIEV